jgi:NAD-dependent SIR2 family protein deacetylase
MADSKSPETTVARLRGILLRQGGPDPVFLLGAGASVKSGIPPSGQLAEMVLKRAYCREHGLSERDPHVVRSDWRRWVSGLSWFRTDSALEDQYPSIVEHLLFPRDERRDFFLAVVGQRRPPGAGYRAMARLVSKGWVRMVLTTNFDDLLFEACRAEPSLRHVQVIGTPGEAGLISTAPAYPQVVHLHGSVAHYTDQNLEGETQRLDPALREQVLPLLRDHPLIVVGYRGAEPSIMHDLLRDAIPAVGYRRGVFWCTRDPRPDGLHPHVRELAEALGENFCLVPIAGFDECMTEIDSSVPVQPEHHALRATEPPPVPDMEPMPGYGMDDLDWGLAERTMQAYARQLSVPGEASSGREWTLARLRLCDLVRDQATGPVPTRAGVLLFGARGAETSVEIRSGGELDVVVSGNVFVCAERVQAALDEHNQPFRLKGPASETVRAYPPLALKELVVNALAHRDHLTRVPVRIDMSDIEIRFLSPGGLVDGLDPARLGVPGVKAYRNPVLADVLYGAGLMDKAGSGLGDVRRWAREIGGEARFEPTPDDCFLAVITSRPERPDPLTGTTAPIGEVQVFTSNVLPVSVVQPYVWTAPTTARSRADIFEAHPRERVPPLALHDGLLLTFSDLGDAVNPLGRDVHGPASKLAVAELEADPDRERILVQLLNSCMLAHARSCQLVSVPGDRRLYFPRTEAGPREMGYQARVRRATRTVTRPVVSRRTSRVLYWEHHAVRFAFERFAGEWGVMLVPTWVFTRDGERDIITGPRVGRLSVVRSARDYNPQVAGDMRFWSWVLTHGSESVDVEAGAPGALVIGGRFVEQAVVDAPVPEGPSGAPDLDPDQAALEEELATLAEAPEAGPAG